jgi:hypothetical protein
MGPLRGVRGAVRARPDGCGLSGWAVGWRLGFRPGVALSAGATSRLAGRGLVTRAARNFGWGWGEGNDHIAQKRLELAAFFSDVVAMATTLRKSASRAGSF